jgi:hypothetical protein
MTVETPPNGPDLKKLMQLMFGSNARVNIYVAAADAHNIIMTYTSLDRLKAALEFYKTKQPGLSSDSGVAKVAAMLPPGSHFVAYASLDGIAAAAQQLATMLPPEQAMTVPEFASSPPIGVAAKFSSSGIEAHMIVTGETLRVIGTTVAKERGDAARSSIRIDEGSF